tara:strand:- start:5549 stop:6172 length:624 start_codon:yes stop_codon:yes gene_type:complete
MAYNTLSGTVIAAQEYTPGDLIVGNVVSGNLSTSDASAVINIPRVSNATNNSVITNVGGDANTLTCETNLTFDGSALTVTGEITASVGVSASVFYGDGSKLTGISASGGSGDRFSVYAIGNEDGNLQVGLNYGSAAITTTRTWTTPSTASAGDVIRIKAPAGVNSTNKLVVTAYANHTIDGESNLSIESPYGALAICYVSSGSYRIF